MQTLLCFVTNILLTRRDLTRRLWCRMLFRGHSFHKTTPEIEKSIELTIKIVASRVLRRARARAHRMACRAHRNSTARGFLYALKLPQSSDLSSLFRVKFEASPSSVKMFGMTVNEETTMFWL